MTAQVKNRIDQLTKLVQKYNHHYYDLDAPLVSDDVYNALYKELCELENQFPEYKSASSPTEKVGGTYSETFQVVKHIVPMISIRTETKPSEETYTSWIEGLEEKLGEAVEILPEYKADGLGLSLTYVNGRLIKALTRGDGEYGEDVTPNAFYVSGIPHSIDVLDKMLTVRGEVLITKEDYAKLNGMFANARNAAAGGLRQHDPLKTKERLLSFFAYNMFRTGSRVSGKETHLDNMALLRRLGFSTLGIEGEYLNNYDCFVKTGERRKDVPIEFDGVVFKVNRIDQQHRLGFRSKDPYWAVAYKYPAEEQLSELLAIDVQVGRTGKITPVGRLKPVAVGGVIVSNVTLNNLFNLRKKGIRVGDTVIVRRAGDVIPEISGYIKEARKGYLPNFRMPDCCPSCGGPVHRPKGVREYYCVNQLTCPKQLVGSVLHYCSRDALDIKGIGEVTAELLVETQSVRRLSDLYRLTETDLVNVGLGVKVASNIIGAIHIGKAYRLAKFIYGLGIHDVGEGTSTRLAKHYATLDDFLTTDLPTLLSIKDIGDVTAKSIHDFITNPDNLKEIEELRKFVQLQQPSEEPHVPITGPLTGYVCVVTGILAQLEQVHGTGARKWLQRRITELGGEVSEKVNKDTTALITGEKPSSKLQKAKDLGIPIYTEDQFLELIKENIHAKGNSESVA